jgi:hypothetical protein
LDFKERVQAATEGSVEGLPGFGTATALAVDPDYKEVRGEVGELG